jgi:hypothetical protein
LRSQRQDAGARILAAIVPENVTLDDVEDFTSCDSRPVEDLRLDRADHKKF